MGITGHQWLADPSAWPWVRGEISRILAALPAPLIGITSLAVGADQIIAELVLEHGGMFQAIIPFSGYDTKLAEGPDRDNYHRLLRLADYVDILTKSGASRQAYFHAGKQVVHMSELLLAVWDGQPAAGLGGTGDVVSYARQVGKPLAHINPVQRTIIHSANDAVSYRREA